MKPVRSVGVVRVRGRVPYGPALDWQRKLATARIAGSLRRDLLLLLEHEPVITVGRGGTAGAGMAGLPPGADDGLARVEIERGGDVTYHGPGQLVGYPILDLGSFRRDLHWYVRTLEAALIVALADLGVEAFRVSGYTGVWVGTARRLALEGSEGVPADPALPLIAGGALRKIASIGVHVSRWVTWHGFALNVSDASLEPFSRIIPCGIDGVRMTSLQSEGASASWDRVLSAVESGFAEAFGVRLRAVGTSELEGEGLGLGLLPLSEPARESGEIRAELIPERSE